ncbi:hypothetical protein [Halomonas heilongjiangensis]|uniref:Uncharacterized protein n=1 Tax=Halomonas heilongjiangensis TaxID=1387883 RepID=A0A2N7TU85_9GAMM|nr:hypothetical protein [Halomonas heilongjiangensis]PMR71745.1 hypothetical protein C1H66_01540 [Halomonas heilongjiangensis]PXX89972.1 hypothetical protein CR158_10335 [Halomonas heilongjiangensis]
MKMIMQSPNRIQYRMPLESGIIVLCNVTLVDIDEKRGFFDLYVAHESPSLFDGNGNSIVTDARRMLLATSRFEFTEFRNDYEDPLLAGWWWVTIRDLAELGVLSDPEAWKIRIMDHVDESIFHMTTLFSPKASVM